ncbi:MAG: Asp-tRNA(Asn)/Glu-tRNA(Gln) amidotransferase subunit GatC [Candidatus Hydrogenedentota bacterium]|nr:MAG: Asp-tRNA(Asn)/Glu-tRNA(Gln) amidotransferase subunit GatC [Candidatus Hydrogenedentota bacterium]
MEKVSSEEVLKIAKLARLKPEGDELESLTKDFNDILEFVSQIQEVDTSSVDEGTFHKEVFNISRPDVPQDSLPLEAIRQSAPHFEAGFFVVPRVIEDDG